MKIDAKDMHYRQLNKIIRDAVASGEKEFELDNVQGQRYIGDGLNESIKITINGTPGNDLGASFHRYPGDASRRAALSGCRHGACHQLPREPQGHPHPDLVSGTATRTHSLTATGRGAAPLSPQRAVDLRKRALTPIRGR